MALFDGCHNAVTLEDNVITYKGDDILDEEPEEPTITEEEEQPLQPQGGLFGGGTIPNIIIPQQGVGFDTGGWGTLTQDENGNEVILVGYDENGNPIYGG